MQKGHVYYARTDDRSALYGKCPYQTPYARRVGAFWALPLCPRLVPRGRSTKSAASSASLRSVLRGVPIFARTVKPRTRSATWLARAATGKSDGISPALIPSPETKFHHRHAASRSVL